jgi:phosphatidyl-myo-inositol dimannoside synthase
VRTALDRADLFVLPSRQEGLPRALLEAMARGLPALSTPVGGIPELLAACDLVPVGDAAALADRIAKWARSPRRLAEAARRNLARARDFHEDALRGRRNDLFRRIAAAAIARQQPLRRAGKESPAASRSGGRS